MNYYRRYIGDYQRDTGHLTLAEHGAYALLLDTYYATDGELPGSIDALCRLCRATTRPEREAVKAIAERYFPTHDDGARRNARADVEIAKAGAKSQTLAANGRKGGVSRASKCQANAKQMLEPMPSKPEATPTSNLQPPREEEEEEGNTTAAARPTRAPEPPEFGALWAVYPKRGGGNPRPRALKAARARLTEGATWNELHDGVSRYAEFCRATGKVGTEYVMQAATFLGPDRRFAEPWNLPATKADIRLASNLDAGAEFLRRTEQAA